MVLSKCDLINKHQPTDLAANRLQIRALGERVQIPVFREALLFDAIYLEHYVIGIISW